MVCSRGALLEYKETEKGWAEAERGGEKAWKIENKDDGVDDDNTAVDNTNEGSEEASFLVVVFSVVSSCSFPFPSSLYCSASRFNILSRYLLWRGGEENDDDTNFPSPPSSLLS